jgi:hypothetical protein
MIKNLIPINTRNLKGLLKIRGEFRFVNQTDIMKLFVTMLYPKKSVVVIYNCKKAFETIPKLNIKKRDDFTTYMMGMTTDIVFVEFDAPLVASDWAFAIPPKSGIHWEVYSNGTLIRNENGVVKPPKIEEKEEPYS